MLSNWPVFPILKICIGFANIHKVLVRIFFFVGTNEVAGYHRV